MRKAALAVIIGLFVPALSGAAVTAVKTRPAGSNKGVQYNDNGGFGSSASFNYDKSAANLTVSTVTVTTKIVWPDGTIQVSSPTAGASGNFINNQSTLQSGATFYVSSGSVAHQLTVYDDNSVVPFAINRPGKENAYFDFDDASGVVTSDRGTLFTHMRAGTISPRFNIINSTQTAAYASDQSGDAMLTLIARNSGAETAIVRIIGGNGVFEVTPNYVDIQNPVDGISIPYRFYDADASNYVQFKASAAVSSNKTFVWPDADGSSGQFLKTDGSGNLSFADAGSGSGTSVYPASATASFPYGVSVSTIVGTDNWSTSGSVVADGTMGSNSGNYNFAGTTITFNQPPTNSTDLIPVLNNLTVSWSTAVTDGAQLGSTETFSGYQTFTSSNGAAITYGLSVGSVTITGLPGAGPLYADASGHVSTTTASSGSGSSPFTQAVSTTNLSMGGHNLTNLGAEGWSVQPSTWLYLTDTGGQALTIGSTVTLDGMSCELVANSTYVFTAHVRVHGGGSATGGVTFQIHGPSGAFVHWMAGGPNNGSTTARFDQGADAIDTNNAQVLSNYNSQAFNDDEITGVINTGSTGGTMYLAVVPHNSASTITIEYGTNMVVTRASP